MHTADGPDNDVFIFFFFFYLSSNAEFKLKEMIFSSLIKIVFDVGLPRSYTNVHFMSFSVPLK